MKPTDQIIPVLAERGLLLKQDKHLPNIVTFVTGEHLRTSWWSHPKAKLIFALLSELRGHPDVLFTKLLYGKVTLVHRRLWAAFLAVASANEAWQVRGLSAPARRLFQAVQHSGSLGASGAAVKELEQRLLVSAQEFHTESGRHELLVEAWPVWSRRVGCSVAPSAAQSRRTLEEATLSLGAPLAALPWSTSRESAT